MDNDEYRKELDTRMARLRLLSHIAEMGLTHQEYTHLQSKMGCTTSEIDEILRGSQIDWHYILDN